MSIFAVRRTLLAGCMLATTPFAAAPVLAQDAAPQAEDAAVAEGNGIVVTARRREETLQDVPIAITAFSGASLERSGAIDITAIADTTPNVTLEPSRGTNSTLTAFIRGVGQQDPVSGFEQGVGIYLDDVYLNRPQGAVLDIYDVDRIEVLRGPQGTLYGRNTVGGAVKYVTKRLPSRFALSARGTYGSYNQADGVLSASAPVGDGTLRLGAAVARLTRDGFGKNLTTGLENYDKDIWAGRLSAEVHGNGFFARLAGDYSYDRSSPRGAHRFIPGLSSGAPVLSNVFDTRGALNTPRQFVEAYGFSLFMEGELNDMLTARSITAYRRDRSGSPIDFDALPAADVDVPAIYRNRQFSQEVQILLDTGKFHGLVGAYFLNANALTQFDVRLFTTVAGLAAFTNADVQTDTLAGFADFTYDFTDQFSLSLGGRYTWDQREARILRQNLVGGGAAVFGGAAIPFGAPSTDFRGRRVFRKFNPKATISFKPNAENQLYASYSQGFKGGGFDPRGVGANAPDLNGDGTRSADEVSRFLSFAPETVDSYEAGYKGSLFDGRLNLSLAAFHARYKNVQIPGSVGCTVGGIATFCGIVSNAGRARFNGVEAEARAKVVQGLATDGDSLILSGSFGYIDAKYQQYITNIASKPTDVAAFRKVQNTPKVTASGTLAYSLPMGRGGLDMSTTVSYRSKTFNFEIPNPFLDQPAYALLDASVVYRTTDGRYSLGLHGKNLLDKRYVTSGYVFLAGDATTGALIRNAAGNFTPTLGREGVLTGFYGNPRQVFLTASAKF